MDFFARKDACDHASRRGKRTRRSPLDVERLGQRLVLSGVSTTMASSAAADLLPVQAVVPIENPYAGTALITDPADSPAFAIRFNQTINLAELSGSDFEVDQVNPDGSLTHMTQYDNSYLESPDGPALVSNRMTISFLSPLDPGTYRLVLRGNSDLSNLLDIASAATNQAIEPFAIGAAAADSIASQQAGPVSGAVTSLTFPVVANDFDHPLNELDLPAGTNWSISPQFGSNDPDSFRVALFDTHKALIASTTGSQISTLNQGLAPGRYYLQFYRLTPMLTDLDQSIQVTVTGTPAVVAAPRVVSITPLNFNNLDANADSVLVQFDPSTPHPTDPTSPQAVYTLIDATGQARLVHPLVFDQGKDQLLLSFSSTLPTGRYSLHVSLPTGPDDSTSNPQTLGSFAVVSQSVAADDLGTIFPQATAGSGMVAISLSPGATLSRRFSVLAAQNYLIHLSNPNLNVQLIQESASYDQSIANKLIGTNFNRTFILEPGIYRVVIANPTTTTQTGSAQVVASDHSSELLQSGGVGQLPAASYQSILVGSLSSSAISQNVTDTMSGPAATGDPAAGRGPTTPESIPPTVTKFEPSSAFSVEAFSQIPLGSLANPHPTSESSLGETTSTASVGLLGNSASNATSSINSMLPGVNPIPTVAVSRNKQLPFGLYHTEILRAAPRRDGSPQVGDVGPDALPSDATGPLPVRLTVNTVASAAEAQPDSSSVPVVALDQADTIRSLDRMGDEVPPAAGEMIELADMTSPIGIVVAFCVIYRRIKATKYGASLPGRAFIATCWQRGLGGRGDRRYRSHQ